LTWDPYGRHTPSGNEFSQRGIATGMQASDNIEHRLAAELGLQLQAVIRTVGLLDEANTIPFITRYRKEATGGLDEVQIEAIATRLGLLRALEARRAEVLRLIGEQGKLTPGLSDAIASAVTVQELDDLYLPFRPKRRTRAMMARQRGLQPLADLVSSQAEGRREDLAAPFVDPAREVEGVDEAYAGARDIVAEEISENAGVRGELRALFASAGELSSRPDDPAKDPSRTYEQYYDFRGLVASLPAHRVLAVNRGEREGALKASVAAPEDLAIAAMSRLYPADDRCELAGDLRSAIQDSFSRLVAPSLERETRSALTERAEAHAITVFARNLRPLLLQPPLRGRAVLGIDPGYVTGCKVAVVDDTGKPLETTVIYPHPPQQRRLDAKTVLKRLAVKHSVTVFAVGSGTASRETEEMVAEVVAGLDSDAHYTLVDEAGASVYSVSEVAREEFPQLDATERSAISIARRVQDPLAELVKVDPRSVGVGLYQHDVDQKALTAALDQVVVSAVTFAGVDLNTASASLLSHVAGLTRKAASAIVHYRELHGKFRSKSELSKVPGIGPRSFEQAAGFLQVPDGADILDRTFIHPESYAACRRLVEEFPLAATGASLSARAARFAGDLAAVPGSRTKLSQRLGIGEPTLADLLENLARPGIDPRTALPAPLLRTSALTLDALLAGTVLNGTVRNVVDFGAFVDIGMKQAGLVHVSELSDRYVTSPLDVVTVGQIVTVRVLSVDVARGRVALSMRGVRK
jgi:uncharacterized protein